MSEVMRHKKDYKLLGRYPSHRKSMLRNLVASLFLHEKIETTYTRAKAVKGLPRNLSLSQKKTQSLHNVWWLSMSQSLEKASSNQIVS